MRNFFTLCECIDKIYGYIDDYELNGFDFLPLLRSEKLESKPINIKLKVIASNEWPALLANPLSWVIVSSKMKLIFEDFAPDHCCFYPINEFFTIASEETESYWLLSFYRKINCMNRKMSDYHEMDGMITGINNLVIDPRLVPVGAHVFLLDRPGTQIIVDQVFVEALVRSNIKGVTLLPERSQ